MNPNQKLDSYFWWKNLAKTIKNLKILYNGQQLFSLLLFLVKTVLYDTIQYCKYDNLISIVFERLP